MDRFFAAITGSDDLCNALQVDFERTKVDDEGKESTKTVRRTLFSRLNPYPQKKVMTFNKHTDDFDFYVNYGDLSFLPQSEIE